MSLITLYNPNETNFDCNGIGALFASAAAVTETLNGMFELELTLPALTDRRTWELAQNDSIIKAHTPRGFQLFRVYRAVKKINGNITVNARHIFYDGLYNITSVTGTMTAQAALQAVYSKAAHGTRFTASSTVAGSAETDIRDKNLVAAILGDGGIVETFGGEILRDNFSVALLPSIGADRGFQIRYRKNLTGLDIEENGESVVTRIKPTARTHDNEPLYLPETYIDSPRINDYFMPKISVVEFSDLRVGDDGMTADSIYIEMRRRVRELFEKGADMPMTNAKIDFVKLSQTVNYAEFAPLEDIRLGDVVTAIHEEMNVYLKAKCIRYEYDPIRRLFNKIEIGEFRPDFNGVITERTVSTAAAVDTTLTAHMGDTNVHFTPEEKAWIRKQMEV